MKIFTVIFLLLCIGCSIAKGPVYFVQSLPEEEVLQKIYPLEDTLILKYYSMGTYNQKVTMRLGDGESIEYSNDTVWNALIKSFSKTNIPIRVSETPHSFDIPDWHRVEKDPNLFKEKILNARLTEDSSKILVVPIIAYYSAWSEEINAGLTAGSISPSGRLEHRLSYAVSICIVRNNDLLYYSGTKKVDTLTRDPSEPYRYHFPQQLWDTLVYMSTRDYAERMR